MGAGGKGLFQRMGGGDSLVDYSLSLCCGGCVAPYSVVIVPCLGLSDPVLLPGPGGRGEEGRLPECGLWALPGLSLLCVTRGWLWGLDWGGPGKLVGCRGPLSGFPCPLFFPLLGGDR